MARPEDFRRLALSLPEAAESAHMDHPDFRVRGKVFATLGYPNGEYAMVKLAPDQQDMLAQAEPAMFQPVPGGWGRKGATRVHLAACDETTLRSALWAAWRRTAPKTLLRQFPDGAL